MYEYELHLMTARKELFRTILFLDEIKYMKNKDKSIDEIAEKLKRSKQTILLKIKDYNNDENQVQMTEYIDYFSQYEKVEQALFLRKVNELIDATEMCPVIPLCDNKTLMITFNTNRKVIDKFRHYFYEHNPGGKETYIKKLPEEIQDIYDENDDGFTKMLKATKAMHSLSKSLLQ